MKDHGPAYITVMIILVLIIGSLKLKLIIAEKSLAERIEQSDSEILDAFCISKKFKGSATSVVKIKYKTITVHCY